MGAHLQNINAHVDAAYEIPVAGTVYLFSGKGQRRHQHDRAEVSASSTGLYSRVQHHWGLTLLFYQVIDTLWSTRVGCKRMLAPSMSMGSPRASNKWTLLCISANMGKQSFSLAPLITGIGLTGVVSRVKYIRIFSF